MRKTKFYNMCRSLDAALPRMEKLLAPSLKMAKDSIDRALLFRDVATHFLLLAARESETKTFPLFDEVLGEGAKVIGEAVLTSLDESAPPKWRAPKSRKRG